MSELSQNTDKGLERRIRKHVHAQRHTFECHVPAGFSELGLRTAESILERTLSADEKSQTKVSIEQGKIRIEKAPFETLHALLIEGLIFSEIKIRIHKTRCQTEQKFQQILTDIDWPLWLPAASAHALEVRADSLNSQIYHEGRLKSQFIAFIEKSIFTERSENKDEQNISKPSFAIDLNLKRDVLEIFLSMSGRDYWKRGHKQTFEHAAPLREDIAACLIQRVYEISSRQLKVNTPTVVLNPFCGTGTLLHEAALHITGLAHSLSDISRWPYFWLPFCKQKSFHHALKTYLNALSLKEYHPNRSQIHYIGEDLQPALCQATRRWFDDLSSKADLNANADVQEKDSCQKGLNLQAGELNSKSAVWIFANPPFGIRLSNAFQGGDETLYRSFGQRLKDLVAHLKRTSTPVCGVVLCPTESSWRILQRSLTDCSQVCEHFTLGGHDIRAFYFFTRTNHRRT
jgi:23S rRNA G2445 N2-methylase RlmL